MEQNERLIKLICESMQTIRCLPYCEGECLQVKEVADSIVKDIRQEAIREFAEKFEQRCINNGFYPVLVRRQLEYALDEMIEKGGE